MNHVATDKTVSSLLGEIELDFERAKDAVAILADDDETYDACENYVEQYKRRLLITRVTSCKDTLLTLAIMLRMKYNFKFNSSVLQMILDGELVALPFGEKPNYWKRYWADGEYTVYER